jgi:hypothetical protein
LARLKSLKVYCRECGVLLLDSEAPRIDGLVDMAGTVKECGGCNRVLDSVDYSSVTITIAPEDSFFGVQPRHKR